MRACESIEYLKKPIILLNLIVSYIITKIILCFHYRNNCACELVFLINKGPVTLLRMRETYEKRMKINAIIFIRTKIL
jgi:hypothetical protein